jgi:hypothetical protein
MKGKFALVLLLVTGASLASVIIGSPGTASMDPFCAS